MRTGPLAGVRVVEFAGLGPGPLACMVLSDLGADVVRVDRVDAVPDDPATAERPDLLVRGRRSLAVNLKTPEGLDTVLELVDGADVLVEPFRPGVAERLGIGPEVCLHRNPRLVYGRMTGWGQDGPWAHRAGHDIDYIALTGALHTIGPADRPPPPPLNLIGDFGGGGMLMVTGVLAALLERERSGQGQVVDAAMVDGTATLLTTIFGRMAMGTWVDEREANLLDGARPYYRTYRCADDRFFAVGAIEPQFYAELLRVLELDPEEWPQHDSSRWPEQHAKIEEIFASRTRDEWTAAFADADACAEPVLSLTEAPDHPHLRVRETYVQREGQVQPAPSPRFSRTPGSIAGTAPLPGEHTTEVLTEYGFAPDQIETLRGAGAVR